MDPTYAADADAYRQKVQAFLAEKLPSTWGGMGNHWISQLRSGLAVRSMNFFPTKVGER